MSGRARAGLVRFGLGCGAFVLCAFGLNAGTAVAAASANPPPPGGKLTFDLNEIRVDGNTVLPSGVIEETVYPFLGPGKSAEDVERAREALEEVYRQRGYPTVSARVPRQRVVGGVVTIAVVERKVERLRITGARYFLPSDIREGAPSVAPGKVPNMQEVQRDIVALNQLPDRTVIPSLRPGRTPDTVDVDLQVQDKLPLHGSLELNNRQSTSTKPLRLLASLSYNNLWQRGDSASVTYQVAPQNTSDANVVSASYLFRVPNSNVSLLASYLKSDSNVTALGNTNVVGKGVIAGFRVLVPLGTAEAFIHSLSAGADYKHFIENDRFGDTTSNAPVTYYPVTVTYEADWTNPGSLTDLTASAVLGIRGWGSDSVAFDTKRYDAVPNFAYLRLNLSHTETLDSDVQFYGNLIAQESNDALVSSEQLGAGGVDTVRGYLESEALGDYGAIGQLEVRSPSLAGHIGGPVTSLRLHVFTDAGALGIRNALPGQTSSYTLASAGGGMRVQLYNHVNGSVEDAVVLTNGPSTRTGSNRVLFRIEGDF